MKKRRRRFGGLGRRVKAGAQNALELARLGRLGGAHGEAYEIVERGATAKLRRYGGGRRSAPLVLVPPLMLTAEIYDVAPELSAVGRLVAAHVDCWVVDFGAPEREDGGMERTLDDHVRAVAEAVRAARAATGRDVHLAGYSQGGMFAYQAAALLRSEGVASLVTFGSPVDIHRNLPSVASDVASRLIRGARPFVEVPLRHIRGLPGQLSSTGFRLLTPRKEAQQLLEFVLELHDRSALEKRESRRRFLAGEGFVAWPGPALQRFFDDIIVKNRMMAGGLVIDGNTVTLADLTCPILYYVGGRDDFARPPSVRAIRHAAPHAETFEVMLAAGHFGLVVGSTSLRDTWPSVIEWVRWRDGDGPRPQALCEPPAPVASEPWSDEPEELFEVDFDYELLTDEVAAAAQGAWRRLGDVYRDASDTLHGLRHQVPRLRELERMSAGTRTSASLSLRHNADKNPEQTFFMWKGRAFSYRDADARVTSVARGLCACGVRPGDRVGVHMATRPSLLSAATALNRIGAVAVLLSPSLDPGELADAVSREPLAALIVDPAHLHVAFAGKRLLLGGAHDARGALPEDVIDMEAIDPDAVALPGWYAPDMGRARDLAIMTVAPAEGGPKISRISNGRWAFSALGVASAATLSPNDTVYCCLPLHHPSGILVAVGGALVSGARLALSDVATAREPARFWAEVRRYGATVCFYAGEMARPLVDAPPASGERNHPLRLFAGSGMRAGVVERLRERFGVGVLELYASTERNLVLANASGEKLGALGRPLPGSAPLRVVRYDFERRALTERAGRLVPAGVNEPGVALVAVAGHVGGTSVRAGAFEDGDRWLVTSDVLRRDADGDYWFVDRLSNMVLTGSGAVATPRVEDALYRHAPVSLAVAVGAPNGDDECVVAYVVAKQPLDGERVSHHVNEVLAPHERPRRIVRVASIPLTDGFRPMKASLRAGTRDLEVIDTLSYDEARERYS